MNKNTKFSGKPIISQVISLLDREDIKRTAQAHKSDYYCKTFKTYDHLVTMLYVILSGCTSLRAITGIMLACQGKINHLGIQDPPKRSTLSDANARRSSNVFKDIYFNLYKSYRGVLSDSQYKNDTIKHLQIVDSTTISLFGDILRGAGRNPIDGKKKGGIKMHTMINSNEDVPCLVRFTSAATHDHKFLPHLNLIPGSIVVFDRGYNDYSQFFKWTAEGVYFVTRIKNNAVYTSKEEFEIAENIDSGVLKDEKIQLEKKQVSGELRRIAYWDDTNKKIFEFITNNFDLAPDKIAEIYKRRWQIELLFKRLKQNFPLKYFLGDSQNAIEIQIWVSLIAQLLLLVIQKQATKRWGFANLMSIIRFHLMSYIDLMKFLNKPDAEWQILRTINNDQTELFSST